MPLHTPSDRGAVRRFGLPLLGVLLIACFAASSGGSSDSAKKWEYKYYLPAASVCDNSNNSLVKGLNELGADGWEVIGFSPAGGESRATIVGLDQKNARTSLNQSVSERGVIQSRVTACPLLLKRRVVEKQ